MHLSPLARDCLRSGLSGAVAAGVFGAATAGALLSTGPASLPAPASHTAPAPAPAHVVPLTLAKIHGPR